MLSKDLLLKGDWTSMTSSPCPNFFQKNTQHSSLWDTTYCEDDAVHKIPHKMDKYWQNQLKISVLVSYKILYRIRYKMINITLVQCPFRQNYVHYVYIGHNASRCCVY